MKVFNEVEHVKRVANLAIMKGRVNAYVVVIIDVSDAVVVCMRQSLSCAYAIKLLSNLDD